MSDVSGVQIIPITKEYKENWEKIFGTKKDKEDKEK